MGSVSSFAREEYIMDFDAWKLEPTLNLVSLRHTFAFTKEQLQGIRPISGTITLSTQWGDAVITLSKSIDIQAALVTVDLSGIDMGGPLELRYLQWLKVEAMEWPSVKVNSEAEFLGSSFATLTITNEGQYYVRFISAGVLKQFQP